MYKGLKLFKIEPVDSDFTAIAITENPAIEEYFLKFNSDDKAIEFAFDEEKQIIYGIVMKPYSPIFRRGDVEGEDYYVFYDESGIQKMVSYFFKTGMKMNIEHGDRNIEVDIIESFFARQINDFNAPIGSWIIKAKVSDKTDWLDIKNMGFTGFSIQGIFKQIEVDSIHQFNSNIEKMELEKFKKAVIDAISNIAFSTEPEVKEEPLTEEINPEEVVEEPISPEEVIVENVVEEETAPVTFSKEEVGEMIKAEIQVFKSEIEDLKTKLEKFGNERLPISTQSEDVENNPIDVPAAKFFSK